MTSATQVGELRLKARELIDTFAKGWAKGQVDHVLSVFAPEAVFVETPFADPLTGTEAIRRYWSDAPYHQAEISVSTGEIYVAVPGRHEFPSYSSGPDRRWVEARELFSCETEGCTSRKGMYWHRRHP